MKHTTFSKLFPNRLTLATALIAGLLWSAQTRAAKAPNCGGGTIYFSAWLGYPGSGPQSFQSMECNGANKSLLPFAARGEPSHLLHNGHRWFLTGTAAVRDDGVSVPLTGTRWALTDDTAVSYGSAEGIVIADVVFDAEGTPAAVPGSEVLVVSGDVNQHDWSPDGTKIVFRYDSGPSGLWIADLTTVDANTGLPAVAQILAGIAGSPAWSPAGTKIAFAWNPSGTYGDTGIATIAPDGSGFTTIVSGNSKTKVWYGYPHWSPTASHLAFERHNKYQVGVGNSFDVVRTTATGAGLTSLTSDLADPKSVALFGWR